MLKKLLIRQFKCFREEDIRFGKITVLAGANGVGKSTVIQSLMIINELYLNNNDGDIYIPVNDKINTFLELGSTKEILYSDAYSPNIEFVMHDQNDDFDHVKFSIDKNNSLSVGGRFIHRNNMSTLPFGKFIHYLNAERLGPRNTQNISAQREFHVGYQGEHTGYVIAEATRQINGVAREKQNEKGGAGFDRQVEAWIDFIIPYIEINIEIYENINQVRIGIRKKGSGTDFLHPNNIGFGISYVLPIIVSGLIAEQGNLLIVENPEAHLHPLGQSRIGQFLAIMAGAGVQIILETHSEHVINGIRIAALKGQIDYNEVMINYFSQQLKEPVRVNPIKLNVNGELDEWPAGFFDQEEKDLSELFQLSRKR